jgi:Tol biopolymer transport system component
VVFSSRRKLDGTDAPNANRTSNIWRANADGTGLTPLTCATALGADSLEPQWSPDSSNVVFRSSRFLDAADAPNPHATNNIWRVNAR